MAARQRPSLHRRIARIGPCTLVAGVMLAPDAATACSAPVERDYTTVVTCSAAIAEQTFVVPPGVRALRVIAVGASGGNGSPRSRRRLRHAAGRRARREGRGRQRTAARDAGAQAVHPGRRDRRQHGWPAAGSRWLQRRRQGRHRGPRTDSQTPTTARAAVAAGRRTCGPAASSIARATRPPRASSSPLAAVAAGGLLVVVQRPRRLGQHRRRRQRGRQPVGRRRRRRAAGHRRWRRRRDPHGRRPRRRAVRRGGHARRGRPRCRQRRIRQPGRRRWWGRRNVRRRRRHGRRRSVHLGLGRWRRLEPRSGGRLVRARLPRSRLGDDRLPPGHRRPASVGHRDPTAGRPGPAPADRQRNAAGAAAHRHRRARHRPVGDPVGRADDPAAPGADAVGLTEAMLLGGCDRRAAAPGVRPPADALRRRCAPAAPGRTSCRGCPRCRRGDIA